jgi:hypothetical protein
MLLWLAVGSFSIQIFQGRREDPPNFSLEKEMITSIRNFSHNTPTHSFFLFCTLLKLPFPDKNKII